MFCGEHLLAAKLRRSNIDAARGATEEIARIVTRIRARWPRVRILLRADKRLRPRGADGLGEANKVDYLFGLARNSRLVEQIHIELAWAEDEAERTGKRPPVRRLSAGPPATAGASAGGFVAKAEWMPDRGEAGANPRFVVTKKSLAATEVNAKTLYERLYCARGDMENQDQGVPARPVRRPHQRGDHESQPAAPVVRLHGLSPARRPAPDRAGAYPTGKGNLRSRCA